ncbi:hypothetical protein CLV84_2350 [Neolewinella xylanilytica]|uniref:Suppressor of fused protein SUFU n=1 Tax=Neolewinella xylanilytica TaxID=1514080 RepID=A0A2S6I2P1_9BACT|nr:hypothetical protein [Neolewinella xylanilytica]PPK85452.1 hypothetical protein CLV84_2350 [Neolewinella xylanilytica]
MRILLFCLAVLFGTHIHAQSPSPWTEADAARYARERTDSTLWDMPRLAEDLSFSFDSLEVVPPLVNLASPVPEYDWGYVSSRLTSLDLAGRRINGVTYAYAYDEYRPAPTDDSLAYYYTYFTIYVLSDSVHLDQRMSSVISRNYPHYLAAGKQVTEIGDVSYVQLSLAAGANLALVARQYFDLHQGRTILVAPLRDGSLRFLQLMASPEWLRSGQAGDAYNAGMIEDFERTLEADPQVIDFFTQPGSL